MATLLQCDICGNATEQIVGKIFYTPLNRSNNANSFHNSYSHHADVGICCSERLLKSFKFRKRKTAKEYHDSRRRSVKS